MSSLFWLCLYLNFLNALKSEKKARAQKTHVILFINFYVGSKPCHFLEINSSKVVEYKFKQRRWFDGVCLSLVENAKTMVSISKNKS